MNIPNWSIQIGDKIGRRSDYFWVLQAKTIGYKIVNVPFATLHNRRNIPFNIQKEENKLLLDLIGSSFTKAIEQVGVDAKKEDFYNALTVGKADAALAASLFHYKELEIAEVKEYLKKKGVSVRL